MKAKGDAMSDLLRELIKKRQSGIACGIASYCTANELVIEAVMEQAKRFDDTVLIEATANQVNQYGGYTGMTPADFMRFVYQIADRTNFPIGRIILGGDHLGPLVWSDENESAAMEKAVELVKLMVSAGYKKIHLDTSMKLADDPKTEPLSDELIARRSSILYMACEEAYQELKKKNPNEQRPVYIIGSEVPIPGGSQGEDDGLSVTRPEAVEKTINAFKHQFEENGLKDAFENIIGVVVQPGVEFGDDSIFHYDSVKSSALCESMKKFDGIVLEGHSTDYQSPMELKKMMEDGIAILKVGPALTFALRKGLYALSMIEKELIPGDRRADFKEVLEKAMLNDPYNWKKHYRGTEKEMALKRKYSFSDRCRYYFIQPEIQNAIYQLIDNINRVDLPLGLLYQYMPMQYIKVRDGKLSKDAKSLIIDSVVEIIDSYNFATKHNYMIGEVFIN